VVKVKSSNGQLEMQVHPTVTVTVDDGVVSVAPDESGTMAMAGTMRSMIANMIHGLTDGCEKQLELLGVRYHAQVQGNKFTLQLGFSHPGEFVLPEGVSIETPSQSVSLVKGSNKQLAGQVPAENRGHRPPEPYKGKGV